MSNKGIAGLPLLTFVGRRRKTISFMDLLYGFIIEIIFQFTPKLRKMSHLTS